MSSEFLLPFGTSLNKGYVLLGILIAIYPLGQFLSTPILGQLSDKYGRKKILGISLLGTAMGYVLFAFAILTKNIPLLFTSRFLDGITGGNISIAQAMISDVSNSENRAKNFGMLGAAFGLGFIIGPFIGGKLSDPSLVSWFNSATPFYFAAILAFMNMLSVVFFIPETNKNLKQGLITWNKSLSNIKKAMNMKGINVIFLTNFLFFGGFTFFTTFFGVFLINKFNFSQNNIGNFFAYVGIWSVFTQAVLTRKLSKYFKEHQIIKYSVILGGIVMLTYFIPKYSWQIFLIPPFFSACVGLSMSNLNSLLSKDAPIDSKGEILGIGASVQALAQFFPAILAGFIAANFLATTPIIIASIMIISAGIVFKYFYKIDS